GISNKVRRGILLDDFRGNRTDHAGRNDVSLKRYACEGIDDCFRAGKIAAQECGSRDRRGSRLSLPRNETLVGPKDKCAIFDDRTASRSPEIIASESRDWRRRGIEKVFGVKCGIAHELENGSV